ncbi:hypothetical protein J6590_003894 [Homalodisca vitripennis]|nr:hypothetical protein J6590_003894 [Homalodisca vitripennis]
MLLILNRIGDWFNLFGEAVHEHNTICVWRSSRISQSVMNNSAGFSRPCFTFMNIPVSQRGSRTQQHHLCLEIFTDFTVFDEQLCRFLSPLFHIHEHPCLAERLTYTTTPSVFGDLHEFHSLFLSPCFTFMNIPVSQRLTYATTPSVFGDLHGFHSFSRPCFTFMNIPVSQRLRTQQHHLCLEIFRIPQSVMNNSAVSLLFHTEHPSQRLTYTTTPSVFEIFTDFTVCDEQLCRFLCPCSHTTTPSVFGIFDSQSVMNNSRFLSPLFHIHEHPCLARGSRTQQHHLCLEIFTIPQFLSPCFTFMNIPVSQDSRTQQHHLCLEIFTIHICDEQLCRFLSPLFHIQNIPVQTTHNNTTDLHDSTVLMNNSAGFSRPCFTFMNIPVSQRGSRTQQHHLCLEIFTNSTVCDEQLCSFLSPCFTFMNIPVSQRLTYATTPSVFGDLHGFHSFSRPCFTFMNIPVSQRGSRTQQHHLCLEIFTNSTVCDEQLCRFLSPCFTFMNIPVSQRLTYATTPSVFGDLHGFHSLFLSPLFHIHEHPCLAERLTYTTTPSVFGDLHGFHSFSRPCFTFMNIPVSQRGSRTQQHHLCLEIFTDFTVFDEQLCRFLSPLFHIHEHPCLAERLTYTTTPSVFGDLHEFHSFSRPCFTFMNIPVAHRLTYHVRNNKISSRIHTKQECLGVPMAEWSKALDFESELEIAQTRRKCTTSGYFVTMIASVVIIFFPRVPRNAAVLEKLLEQ